MISKCFSVPKILLRMGGCASLFIVEIVQSICMSCHLEDYGENLDNLYMNMGHKGKPT